MSGTFKGLLIIAAVVGFSQVSKAIDDVPEIVITNAIPERHAVGPTPEEDPGTQPIGGAIPERHAVSSEVSNTQQTKLDLNAPF